MSDISKIEVPSVPRPDIDLADEYRRVTEELSRFSQELTAAGNPLLASQIKIEDSGVHVRYNPNDPKSMPSVEPLTLEGEYNFLYGEYSHRGGGATAMLGLKDFFIKPDGDLSVSTYVKDRYKNFIWSPRGPARPEDLNKALTGLVSQHNELLADRLPHSVADVVVPSVTKA